MHCERQGLMRFWKRISAPRASHGLPWIQKPSIHLQSILRPAKWDSLSLQNQIRYCRIMEFPVGRNWQKRLTNGTRIVLPGIVICSMIILASRWAQAMTTPTLGIHWTCSSATISWDTHSLWINWFTHTTSWNMQMYMSMCVHYCLIPCSSWQVWKTMEQ